MNTMRTAILTALLLLSGAAALAISLPVAEDTFTTRGILTPANGTAAMLALSSNQAALLKFDLTSLPPSFTATNIVSARLKIYVITARTPGDMVVTPLTSDWTEAVITNTAMPTFDTNTINSVPGRNVLAKHFVIMDVTPAVIATLEGVRPNFGFLLQDTSGRTYIASKEGPSQGPSAELEIEANLALNASGGGSFPGSLNVGGSLNLAGFLRQGSEKGTAEPAGSGLITRRLQSTNSAAGSVVARTDTLTLERDGTLRGWRIVNTANPGQVAITAIFLGADSRQSWRTIALANPTTAGTNVLFSDADLATPILHLRCIFGDPFDLGHQTEVSLSHSADDSSPNWIGTVISSFNQ